MMTGSRNPVESEVEVSGVGSRGQPRSLSSQNHRSFLIRFELSGQRARNQPGCIRPEIPTHHFGVIVREGQGVSPALLPSLNREADMRRQISWRSWTPVIVWILINVESDGNLH